MYTRAHRPLNVDRWVVAKQAYKRSHRVTLLNLASATSSSLNLTFAAEHLLDNMVSDSDVERKKLIRQLDDIR